MICPGCGRANVSRVVDSRLRKEMIYRRRECTVCGCKFSTQEKIYKPKRRQKKDGKHG